MQNVTLQTNRPEVLRRVHRLRDLLAGRAADPQRLRESILLRMGTRALSFVQKWYETKADGGTDPSGLRWPDLSPKTKAYSRRFGKGEQSALKKAAGVPRGANKGVGGKGGLLTKAQQTRWNKLYSQKLAWLRTRYPEAQARGIAAGSAWKTIKGEGAKTKLDVFGSRKVQILRDTGILFNSVSPGLTRGSGDGFQVFAVDDGAVTVGTNTPYAIYHHRGTSRMAAPAFVAGAGQLAARQLGRRGPIRRSRRRTSDCGRVEGGPMKDAFIEMGERLGVPLVCFLLGMCIGVMSTSHDATRRQEHHLKRAFQNEPYHVLHEFGRSLVDENPRLREFVAAEIKRRVAEAD